MSSVVGCIIQHNSDNDNYKTNIEERSHDSSNNINNTHHTTIRDGRDSGSSNNKTTILLFVIG